MGENRGVGIKSDDLATAKRLVVLVRRRSKDFIGECNVKIIIKEFDDSQQNRQYQPHLTCTLNINPSRSKDTCLSEFYFAFL